MPFPCPVSPFNASVTSVQAVAARAQAPKVLNAPEDRGAALARSAAALVQSVAVADPIAALARIVAAQAPNAAAVDLIAVEDHDAVEVHNAAAFPHVARAPGGRVLAHNYAQVHPAVVRESRFAPGVRVGHGDLFQPVAGSFPGVPAVRFAQDGLFSRAVQYVRQEFRFPLPAVWWEQLTVVVLWVTNRRCLEYL